MMRSLLNSLSQGLSSSLWTRDIRSVGKWIGPSGSDAGIVNVVILFCFPCNMLMFVKGECWNKWS